jgi:ABC-type dipeptide/oligopeptide/nickel transport system permease component
VRDDVSGDLLEEYRESIHPSRGQFRADMWYLGQVARFFWDSIGSWSALLSASYLARTALDWLAPTSDFHLRSVTSTLIGAGILSISGFLAGWRARSLWAGMFAGAAIPIIAAPISFAGSLLLLAFNHDPNALAAIQASGGLAEALTLPAMLVIPGIILGTFGGLVADGTRRLV